MTRSVQRAHRDSPSTLRLSVRWGARQLELAAAGAPANVVAVLAAIAVAVGSRAVGVAGVDLVEVASAVAAVEAATNGAPVEPGSYDSTHPP